MKENRLLKKRVSDLKRRPSFAADMLFCTLIFVKINQQTLGFSQKTEVIAVKDRVVCVKFVILF